MAPQRGCRRCRASALALGSLGAVLTLQASCFSSYNAAGRPLVRSGLSRSGRTALQVTAGMEDIVAPLSQVNSPAIAVSLLLFVIALPGVSSTITRTGQAKFVEKTYVMPGASAGGLEVRSIAGGVAAYFRSLNYKMEESPQESRIRFVGQLEANFGQASFLTFCLAGTIFATGLLAQTAIPDGPFGLGPDWWFLPIIFSPWAGWYYWQRAARKDIVEVMLGSDDGLTETSLVILGDQATIERVQEGVRFQSAAGKLFRLMEPDMEYLPGLFGSQAVTVIKEGAAA